MARLYFAHCPSDYGTRRELDALVAIKERFPRHEVINPGALYWQEAYKSAQLALFPVDNRSMAWFHELLKDCDVLVYMSALPHTLYVGAGTAAEILEAIVHAVPVYGMMIDLAGELACPYVQTYQMPLILTIEETRKVIRDADTS